MATDSAQNVGGGVPVRVKTYVDEEMRRTLSSARWERIRSDSPRLYGCVPCELLSESTRPYPGAWSTCPQCGRRMAQVKYILRD